MSTHDELIQSWWQSGSPTSFLATLIERLVARFRGLGAPREDAEDLAQDVMVTCATKMPRVCDGSAPIEERLHLVKFAYVVAHCVWVNRARRHARTADVVVVDIDDEHDVVDDDIETPGPGSRSRVGLCDIIVELIDSLPEKQRELARMHFIEHMEHKAIASRLGKKEGAVSMSAHRIRVELQTYLQTTDLVWLHEITNRRGRAIKYWALL